ncbi:MAG: preprotein translocase subunit SecG [Deltaproteobacteria bacterium]|nr:preprotein translocase subunit SecG [Deltaproteobacteria bacterium]
MSIVVTIIHVLACIFLVLVVLLQTGKGADMGAVFGGSSTTVFGSSGAGNFLSRLTVGVAVVFMLTSLGLTYLSTQRLSSSVLDAAPLSAPPPIEQGAGEPAPAAEGGEAAPEPAPNPQPQAAAEPAAPAAALPAEAPAAN